MKPTFPVRLQKLNLTTVTQYECNRLWMTDDPPRKINPRYQFCGGNQEKDVCRGDSGGPVMYKSSDGIWGPSRYFLVGLVSYGEHCTIHKPPRPSVFVKVSNYMQWILDNIYE